MLLIVRSFAFLLGLRLAFAVCPHIVNRDEWKARAPKSLTTQKSPVPFIVVHHGGIPKYCTSITECTARVQDYQNLHMDVNGWDDLGYSFVVGEDGNVYEGRGWDRVGAHAPGYNNQSIGICVIGDFTSRLPSATALEAVKQLIVCGVERGSVLAKYTLIGHRQTRETECPGETLYREISTWPHYDPKPTPRKYKSSGAVNLLNVWGFTLLLSVLTILVARLSLQI